MDHQTCPDWRNPILISIRNRSDYPGDISMPISKWKEWFKNDTRRKGDNRPKFASQLINSKSRLHITRGEVSGISSWTLGLEERGSDHATEGSRKVRTQLGRSLHHRRSGRQGVVHLGRSGWEPTQEAIEFFSLEAILCVNHVIFYEKIIFCYLICVSPPLISASSIMNTLNCLYGSSP